MTYRKIIVEEKEYEYVVGKTHTKIKGVGVFKNEDIGHWCSLTCECCGEPMTSAYPNKPVEETSRWAISPRDIRRVIELGN